MQETTLLRKLPRVSARGTFLLAAAGLACVMLGVVGGVTLLVPAGVAGAVGLAAGLTRALRVWRGKAYAGEGRTALVAATFVNASLALFVALAGYILLRFGP
jgi:hypothetical protein